MAQDSGRRSDSPQGNPVFLRTGSIKRGLKPPYKGPCEIVNSSEKVFRILRNGKEVSVSVHSLKPTYIPKELVDIPADMS
ncbi:hypothetical protein NPIL_524971 [Nephila pilipes]|uniref:Reverse transcriptase domain-containing protein n=1 Tax=Nephila pilipes TaxID=299642 RepID=A0A8X6TM96_NEPPI|nr:hypothetical protein NPIL_524971 [Nephila pilipes]